MANTIQIAGLSNTPLYPSTWTPKSIANAMAHRPECGFSDPTKLNSRELLAAMGYRGDPNGVILQDHYYNLVRSKCIEPKIGLSGKVAISEFKSFLLALQAAGLKLPNVWDSTPAAAEALTPAEAKAKGQKIQAFIDLFDWTTLQSDNIQINNPALIEKAKGAITSYMENLDMVAINANLAAAPDDQKHFIYGILVSEDILFPTIELK